jgi:uncharacterized protein YyaL (SSP411 family)
MKLTTACRVAKDLLLRRSLRENYWAFSRNRQRISRLLDPSNRAFSRHVLKDYLRFQMNTVRPITGETRERAEAAVGWILRAQAASGDGGVSLGYFPCNEAGAWRDSYPETTGYIITSLLQFAESYGNDQVRESALQMAEWEIRVQMASGAVQGGTVCPTEKQTATAFNTGMVLDGWCSAYAISGDRRFRDAGRRAADFLVGDVNRDGYFRTNGQFVSADQIKTYNCLCAWSLYRFGTLMQEPHYQETAVRVVEVAIRQQAANGWIANNCLTRSEAPLLHTIGYALQGMLEVGLLAQRADFVSAAQRGTNPLLSRVSGKGFVHGCFYADWEPACFSSCLTGSAQLAVVCYRLFEQTGDQRYRAVADRLVNYLKSLQALDAADPNVNGALAGSFPLLGGYMTGGYPNWATKYFLDGLMLQDRLRRP